jgi:transposase InsO family protein
MLCPKNNIFGTVIEHTTAESLSLFASPRGTRFEAIEALRAAATLRRGYVSQGATDGVTLRQDHGSQFIAKLFQSVSMRPGPQLQQERPASQFYKSTILPDSELKRPDKKINQRPFVR